MLQDLPLFSDLKGCKTSSLLRCAMHYIAAPIYPARSDRTRLDYCI